MVDQSTALDIAREYLKAVKATGVQVRYAYLFGSFAQNRQHTWSDIDIALIADDFTGLTVLDKDQFQLKAAFRKGRRFRPSGLFHFLSVKAEMFIIS